MAYVYVCVLASSFKFLQFCQFMYYASRITFTRHTSCLHLQYTLLYMCRMYRTWYNKFLCVFYSMFLIACVSLYVCKCLIACVTVCLIARARACVYVCLCVCCMYVCAYEVRVTIFFIACANVCVLKCVL